MNSSQRTKLSGRYGLLSLAFVSILLLSPTVAASSPLLSAGNPSSLLSSVSPSVVNRTLTSPNAQSEGEFGYSVAVSGRIAVVGAYRETVNGLYGAGHAYTFNAATGALISTLTSPNPQYEGWFGYSVAISGNVAVVGAYGETANGQLGAGHVYAFNATTGALISTLTSPKPQSYVGFGWSVGVSGNIAVVGVEAETVNGQQHAGRAYTFNATTGTPISTLTSPRTQRDGWFGYSVAISGNNVVVGAFGENARRHTRAGHVYLFNAKTGALSKTLTGPNPQDGSSFGLSVAISGNIAVVGAYFETVNGQAAAGRAYAFNAKTGALISTLTSPNPQYEGWFGTSVAISGRTAFIGANGETVNGQLWVGHAYTFNAKTGALIGTFTSANPQYLDGFGLSVAISGNVAVVGAYGEPVDGQQYAGHAYIF